MFFEAFEQIGNSEVIEETVRGYSGEYNPNMSSIYTKLVQTAGRYCERFASDIIIDIDCVKDAIESQESKDFYFGFRSNGVDHNPYIENQDSMILPYYYHKVLKLEIKFDFDEKLFTARLTEVEYSVYKENKIKRGV